MGNNGEAKSAGARERPRRVGHRPKGINVLAGAVAVGGAHHVAQPAVAVPKHVPLPEGLGDAHNAVLHAAILSILEIKILLVGAVVPLLVGVATAIVKVPNGVRGDTGEDDPLDAAAGGDSVVEKQIVQWFVPECVGEVRFPADGAGLGDEVDPHSRGTGGSVAVLYREGEGFVDGSVGALVDGRGGVGGADRRRGRGDLLLGAERTPRVILLLPFAVLSNSGSRSDAESARHRSRIAIPLLRGRCAGKEGLKAVGH